MSNTALFKEAIAEAKAVREAAMANAKAALEETITPHLQSMLAAKIEEMASEDEEEVEEVETEATTEEEEMENEMPVTITEEEETEAEEEVEAEEESTEEESEEEETEEEEAEEEAETEAEEEIEIEDMSMEDLEALISDIVAQQLETEEEEAEEIEMVVEPEMEDESEEESMEDESEEEEEDAISMDELLAEIEEISEGTDEEVTEEAHEEVEEGMDGEAVNEFDLGYATNVAPELIAGTIAALGALGLGSMIDTKELKKMAPAKLKALAAKLGVGKKNEEVKEETHMEEELNEALETISTLREELSETNLLNAKLLYVNKIFKANNLTEGQKVNTITAFDKANTVKEVKLVFETISEGLTKTAVSSVNENKGFASKAAGVAPKTITEAADAPSNSWKERMQVLAGIRSNNN